MNACSTTFVVMALRSRSAAHVALQGLARAACGIAFILGLVLPGCSSEETEAVPFETIASGASAAGAATPASNVLGYRIIADSTAWAELWHGNFATPFPEFRFPDELALYIQWGTQPTGGYGVEIHDLKFERKSGSLHVGVGLQEPGPDEMVTQALSVPFTIARLQAPRVAGTGSVPAVRFSRFDATPRQSLDAVCLDAVPSRP